jgi:hypothetical protein
MISNLNNFRMIAIIVLFFGLCSPSNTVQALWTEDSLYSSDITFVEFQGLLISEINSVFDLVQETGSRKHRPRGRFLRAEEDLSHQSQDLWNRVLQHGWDMSQTSSHMYSSKIEATSRRNLKEIGTDAPTYPFLVCSHSSLQKSGFQRLEPMLKRTGAQSEDASIVSNDLQKTCFHVSLTQQASQELRESMPLDLDSDDDYYTIVPMTDLMKIQADTMKDISDDSWTVPSTPSPNDWERLIRVGLSAGHRKFLSEDGVKSLANDIFDDIRSLGQVGSNNRRRRLQEGKNSSDEEYNKSLSNMFSLTAHTDTEVRSLRRKRPAEGLNEWNRALELGMEADHSCQGMFDTLDLNVHQNNQGFDIVLNPSTKSHINHNDGIENKINSRREEEADHDGIEYTKKECGTDCSASNKHCVTSFIMALSTHPSVLSIETEGPMMNSDLKAPRTTQTISEGEQPLRDIGIDGTNQIISIIDSGFDIGNSYLGPTDPSVLNVSADSKIEVSLFNLYIILILRILFLLP